MTDILQTSRIEPNITEVYGCIKGDRRSNVKEIATNVGISFGRAETIIVDKFSSLFIDYTRQSSFKVSQRLLERFQVGRENFLYHFVIRDEI